METTKEPASSTPGPRRVIKRYSNRKLYDTRDSRYVTLQQIGEMVRAGEEVQIIDNKTKEDKTEVTLALILSEGLRSEPRSVPLATLRDLIQERGEKLWSQLKETPIGRLIPAAGAPGGPAAPEPAPVAEVAVAERPEEKRLEEKRADEKKGEEKPGRLSELMHSSLASLVPSAKSFHDLQEQVQRLTQRVEDLERQLAEQKNSRG